MWPGRDTMRVGLGVMRLSTERTRREDHAREVVHAALDGGVRVFDTACAYGLDEHDLHHNERWLGRFLAEHPRGHEARVITKGGMQRRGLRWIPDGRAATLEAHCLGSRAALGRPIDLYVSHVPDPKTPWATQVRALQSLRARGLVTDIGLSNVTRGQLEEALTLAPELVAVELAFSLLDDSALRSGVLPLALERGLTVLCHSPLGGPKKYRQLGATPWLVERAAALGCTPWEWALAQTLSVSPQVLVLPGARRVETVQSCVRAATLSLEGPRGPPAPPPAPTTAEGTRPQVRLLMGLQGAGKTTAVEASVREGFRRLNRDTEGGTLDRLHTTMEGLLARGVSVVLDNTYVTRAQRGDVLQRAKARNVEVHGVWHDISVEQAQLNIALRMLSVHGQVLGPEPLRRGRTPDTLGPLGFFRTVNTVEPPGEDEGFTSLTRVPFVRRGWPWEARTPALFVDLATLEHAVVQQARAAAPTWPCIVLGWKPGGVTLPEGLFNAVCPHDAGAPACWCRPPLPALALFHARALGVSLELSVLVSDAPALRKLGAALGLQLAR